MALDTMMDVKPTIRRACWEEWSAYYTYGQTRDRVEYAAMRRRQLGQTSNFDEGEVRLPKEEDQSAADQGDAPRDGASQSGASQGGASQSGARQSDASQGGTSQGGPSRSGTR